jgi:voltage-gated potassium channel
MPFESSNPNPIEVEPKRPTSWQLALRRFFNQAWVEISIGLLVIVSVLLTLFEFWLELQFHQGANSVPTLIGTFYPDHLIWMIVANEIITSIFVVELTLRYFAASSKRRFFQEFWLDILATIPLFRVFRAARVLRLLRLVRLLRLAGVISRLSSHYPYIFRRGAMDFLIICGVLMLAIAFGTLAIMHFENQGSVRPTRAAGDRTATANTNVSDDEASQRNEFDLNKSFWFSIYTLFAHEPVPQAPRTLSGKLVTVFLMFMGLTIFAIFAGTVSAFMVDRMRMEGRIVEWDSLQDHIVICGWTPKTKIIIDEYRANEKTRKTPIVVITELDLEQMEDVSRHWPRVHFVHDDFTKVSALKRAGINTAKTCLVLSDTSGNRSEQDADARTILASLTVEKINESVYTCAELVNRSYATHLETGKVNDFVVSGEYGAHMLAQAAMNRGLIGVLSELLTYQRGNEFHRIAIPESWVGASFDQKLSDVRKSTNVILVAVHPQVGGAMVNPENYNFQTRDEIIVISRGTPKLS